MKKKFLILTLCFTIIFSSINFNKSYADGGVISLPILATICSLAVASNIVIENNDDLYDIGRLFYDYIDNHNELTWDVLKTTFNSSVSVLDNGFVSTDSKFLNIVKDFFNSTFSNNIYDGLNDLEYNIPVGAPSITIHRSDLVQNEWHYGSFGSYEYKYILNSLNMVQLKIWHIDKPGYDLDVNFNKNVPIIKGFYGINGLIGFLAYNESTKEWYKSTVNFPISGYSFPYNGGYTWDNVESKKENESVALPIPGNLGQLVGQGSSDFWDNTDNLVGTGGVTIPGVDDPSIGIDDSITFPNVGDVPSDTPVDKPSDIPFANITEYIISLVVPSDSYWTDTFGGLYNNFTSSFPMVDMDNFNNLVTGEKKFPNIDVNIMGVKGRVVNGDVINSIVDWLRPIIAGFMMLCLMLFNYRKIYKTIRGVEPFQGIAHGTSDFRTGISEYNYMGTGLSKSDYEANQMELAKALHDYEQDTGKTYKIKI